VASIVKYLREARDLPLVMVPELNNHEIRRANNEPLGQEPPRNMLGPDYPQPGSVDFGLVYAADCHTAWMVKRAR
jgi:hypothetical protein